jgi:nucleoside-diphosphate-sugar epimerase
MLKASILKSMKILVTGANSYVGSHVAESLATQGHKIVGTFRRQNTRSLNFTNNTRVKMVRLDLSRVDDFKQLDSDFEAVIHNAGSFPWIDVDVNNVVECNVLGTLNLCNWLIHQNLIKRLVTFSTLSVYGHVVDRILTENTPTNASEIYGSSKLASEHLISQLEDYEDQLIVRFPIVLGNQAHRAFIPRLVESFQTNSTVEITNPNKPYNSLTTLQAVADFTNHFLKSDLKGKHITNIGADDPMTVLQIAEFLKTTLKSNSAISVNPLETNCYLIDNTVAKNLGYQAPTVQNALNYYSKESGWT